MTNESGSTPSDLAQHLRAYSELVEILEDVASATWGENILSKEGLEFIKFNKISCEASQGLCEDLIAKCSVDAPSQALLEWSRAQWEGAANHLDWYLNKHSSILES